MEAQVSVSMLTTNVAWNWGSIRAHGCRIARRLDESCAHAWCTNGSHSLVTVVIDEDNVLSLTVVTVSPNG